MKLIHVWYYVQKIRGTKITLLAGIIDIGYHILVVVVVYQGRVQGVEISVHPCKCKIKVLFITDI